MKGDALPRSRAASTASGPPRGRVERTGGGVLALLFGGALGCTPERAPPGAGASVPAASVPAASVPAASVPAASVPAVPAASVPAASVPAASVPAANPPALAVLSPEALRGQSLARTFCASCHLEPAPSTLPRGLWPNVLDVMGIYLGHDSTGLLTRLPDDAARRHFVDLTRLPASPLVTQAEWASIRRYFHEAPGETTGDASRQTLGRPSEQTIDASAGPPAAPLQNFEVLTLPLDVLAPIVSLVRIAPGQGLYVGEARTRTLRRLDPLGHATVLGALSGPPVDLHRVRSSLFVTTIGSLEPLDDARGAVEILPLDGPAAPARPLLDGLYRPTQTVVADLDGDGDEDLLPCQFGHFAGRLGWYERKRPGNTPGTFVFHELLPRPGAVAARVGDFDADGKLDLLVLMAQALEGLHLFHGEGRGRFTEHMLLNQSPVWGYTDLALADLDGDRRPELILANGDNGDLPGPPLKAYHGLRVYAWDGRGTPELRQFIPVAGAYRMAARDFDLDGDLDLAVAAFFPDARRREEGFVYLENLGAAKFARHATPAVAAGHWLTLDAGDLDGDGDQDLVLGAAYPEIPMPQAAQDPRLRFLPGLMLLRNRAR